MLRAMTNTGRFVWYELLTTDPQGAIAFYSEVVGWKTQPFGDSSDYTMWVGEQGPLGGVTLLPDDAKRMGVPPYWQANVEVANVDETVAKVKELGGQVHHQEDVPTIGRFAVIGDPQGAVISVYISEVFPNRVRAKRQSLGSFTHWIMAALISLGFPAVARWSRPLPFVFFAAITVVQFIVVLMAYPETKGVSLEEIQKEMSVA